MKKDIGALWKRTGQYGDYISGVIEINGTKHNFRVYENFYKKADKEPDYKIFPIVDKAPERAEIATPKISAIKTFVPMDDSEIPF